MVYRPNGDRQVDKMAETKTFTVTMSAYNWDVDYLNANEISSRLQVAFRDRDVFDIQVKKYDPANEEVHHKIPAIKRIRTLLQCNLRDAKFLADSAQEKGSVKWAQVEIVCVANATETTSARFKVIDNS